MAGRIPQGFIDDLLAKADIVDIIDSRVKLKKTGRNYSACCPFHKEKSASFSVSPSKQFYYCFGCGASGNALSFIMDFDHLGFPEAVDDLAKHFGQDVPREQAHSYKQQPDYTHLYQTMEKAAKFFQKQLSNHAKSSQAIGYLKHRGLTGQISQQFGIGYAPPGWNNLQTHFGATSDQEKRLIQSGLLVENDDNDRIYDRFRDRIMFPIRDTRGRTIAFGGRVLGDGKPKYLNSPETAIFHKGKELYGLYEAKKANRSLHQVIVVEGYMDVVALAQQGLTNSVATLGTATTTDHMQRLFKAVSEVVFCFDGDDAGRRAAWRALESTLSLMEDGRQARFLFLPQGEDPDSVVRQEGAEAFKLRIQTEALSLDGFLFRELEDGLDLTTMDGRARLAKLAQPHIEQLPKGIFKQLMLQTLAERTGLEAGQLSKHFGAGVATQPIKESIPSSVDTQEGYDEYHAHGQAVVPAEKRYQQKVSSSAPRKQAKPTSKMSGAGYAIRQLLCNTKLADNVENVAGLKQSNSPDSLLLVKLLETLKNSPGLSAIALIAQEQDTENGQRLKKLAEFDLGVEANEQEFHETLNYIRNQVQQYDHKERQETLKKQLSTTSMSQVNSLQRQELQRLIDQKRQQLCSVEDGVKKK